MLIAPENETVSPPINEIDYYSSCISSPVFLRATLRGENNHVNLKYLHSPKENVNGRDCAEDPSVKFLQEARTDQPITRLPSHRNGGFSDLTPARESVVDVPARLRQEDKCSPTRNEPSFRLSKSCNCCDRQPWPPARPLRAYNRLTVHASSREFTKPNSRCNSEHASAEKCAARLSPFAGQRFFGPHSWRCTIGGQASRPRDRSGVQLSAFVFATIKVRSPPRSRPLIGPEMTRSHCEVEPSRAPAVEIGNYRYPT
ncbi:hypothetical protein G5I_09954 [Acromyrmex echinatior]|uniref:Uncharacterized protein n=1 Tax=Acromyrmex echinatior TaxID=103372 RepID=F4WVL2_ACREC|nr:hypothetical protein G5I_09954 [Acromyrmex echinatior]